MDALVRSLFLSGSYSACTSKDTESLSLRSLGYIARAYLADRDVAGARQILEDNNIDKNSVLWVLMDVVENGPSKESAEKVREIKENEVNKENIPVVGTVLFRCGYADEAVRALESMLELSQGDELSAEEDEIQQENKEECLYFCISVLLAMNRHDLAWSTYKKYAGDSVCMQQCEAWLSLVEGGHRSQAAFYAFDELLNIPGARNHSTLNGRALARILQGHQSNYHEATIDLDSASQLSSPCSHTVANHAVLALLQSRNPDSYLTSLSTLDPSHPLLSTYSAQEELFETAAAEFRPSVVV